MGGKLAQIGSRLVDSAARKIAAGFFKRFSAQLQGAPESQEVADAGESSEQGKKSWTAWISKS